MAKIDSICVRRCCCTENAGAIGDGALNANWAGGKVSVPAAGSSQTKRQKIVERSESAAGQAQANRLRIIVRMKRAHKRQDAATIRATLPFFYHGTIHPRRPSSLYTTKPRANVTTSQKQYIQPSSEIRCDEARKARACWTRPRKTLTGAPRRFTT